MEKMNMIRLKDYWRLLWQINEQTHSTERERERTNKLDKEGWKSSISHCKVNVRGTFLNVKSWWAFSKEKFTTHAGFE